MRVPDSWVLATHRGDLDYVSSSPLDVGSLGSK